MKLYFRINIVALFFFLLNFLCVACYSHAQQVPIGNWKEYLPYQNPICVTASDNKVYCIAGGVDPKNGLSLYSVNKSDNSFEHYSKVTGLSDIGYNNIAFDKVHQLLLIAYTNSNIDLLEPTGVINIPDIERKNIVGDKAIYSIYFSGDFAYLSCGFGIVVIDIVKNEISDTYYIGRNDPIRVYGLTSDGQNFYAASDSGVYKASVNSPDLAYFASWTNISGHKGLPNGAAKNMLFTNGTIYTVVNNALYQSGDTSWTKIYSQQGWIINNISAGNDSVILSEVKSDISAHKLSFLSRSGKVDSLSNNIAYPLGCYQDKDGSLWVANFYGSLTHITGNYAQGLAPNGPSNSNVNKVAINNHNVYVAPSGLNQWNPLGSRDGFYARINDTWENFNLFNYSPFDSVLDLFQTAVNPTTNLVYFCSYGGGLVEFNDNAVTNIFKQNSSLQGAIGDLNSYRASGIAFDKDGNMWLSNFLAPRPICLRTTDGKWYSFKPNVDLSGGNAGPIVVDQNNYKWIILEQQNGILVYDSGVDPTDPSDDRYIVLSVGVGKGNLPTSAVHSLAVDKDGQVWVGTEQGVAVYYCSQDIFDNNGCDAQQILVKQDQYYNYLLVNDVINDIAVDGANRKWFATNTGVYLMSADGTQQIYHFDEANSPLFSDFVNTVAIDDKTGEVFIGTDKGLMVFRSTAEDEALDNCAPLVYPNPVKKEYDGPIAIKGLVSDSQVKITDISGHLIYQTIALGTQAIWDGKTLKGERAASGVYLVYAASPDGSKTCTTKLVLIN